MIGLKKIYRRTLAGVMLFTTEAALAILLFGAALFVFLALAKYVFLDNKVDFDTAAFLFIQQYISESTTRIMQFFTVFGNYQVLVTANLLLICYFLFVRKHKWYSIKIPAIALSSVIVMSLLKLFFNRSRPLSPLLEAARGLSFPSGHAMSSVTFFGLLIYYVYRNQKNPVWKFLLILTLVFLISIIGFSRVYLRVHYASDVLAGFCAGIIWLMIAIRVLRKIEMYSKRKLNKVVEQSQII
ncbi:phosphatase PAP2 family protein [Desertivirga xinjiangensis]|uniref:phosphatase PAP2 family protein n=1 Tax=Desertivirga xinjiangensis TaxID=539206 RepID=UPI0021098EB2|nr:phosphatase PAP2 family protein [Pedobacter xinjiangensis]